MPIDSEAVRKARQALASHDVRWHKWQYPPTITITCDDAQALEAINAFLLTCTTELKK